MSRPDQSPATSAHESPPTPHWPTHRISTYSLARRTMSSKDERMTARLRKSSASSRSPASRRVQAHTDEHCEDISPIYAAGRQPARGRQGDPVASTGGSPFPCRPVTHCGSINSTFVKSVHIGTYTYIDRRSRRLGCSVLWTLRTPALPWRMEVAMAAAIRSGRQPRSLDQTWRAFWWLVSYGRDLERRCKEIFAHLRKPLGHKEQTHDAA